jgi:TP901 family phage tail tape measure protein
MIEALAGNVLLGYLSPVALFTAAICLLVLRAGASRVFFDIVGTFQASKMISDAKSAGTVFEAIYLDALTGVQEAAQELGQVFNELTDFVVPIAREIQEATIQLEKFVQEGENVDKLVKDVEKIGLEFGFAGDEAMQAAAKMAQISGVLGPGSMAVGTQIGMEFGLISGMETEAAMQRMINLQQQTEFMTKNLEDNMTAEERATQIRKDSIVILDQLNTIENRSAATMEQITFVMNQFASQAHLANEEIKTMAALSAVMIETGEEQGKGGRALRMMYARLGSDIGGAATELENLGIAITDANGDMRGLSDILMQLEPQFNEMDGARKQEVAQIVAGNRHYTRLLKIMNNLDRVRELEFEATMRMFPAMDEIQRRRDNELFQLEQSEANVRNLAGALGTQLLPAMTDISNKQAIFLQTVVALNEGPLGGMITGMMALAKSSAILLGPVVNTLINFKNMSIAFQTHAAITRALTQQQELLNGGFAMTGRVTVPLINTYNSQQAAIKMLKTEHEMLIAVLDEEMYATDKSISQLRVEEVEMRELARTTDDLVLAKLALAQVDNIQKQIIVKKAQEGRDEAQRQKEEIDLAKEKAQAFNGITMAMAGTGSAMMMFGKSQRMVRAGMVLNTAAMGAQIIAMIHKNREQTTNLFLTTSASIKQAALTAQTTLAAMATNGFAFSLKSASAGLVAMRAGILSVAKVSGPFIALIGVSYGITYMLEKLGIFADDAADSLTEFSTAIADTGVVLSMLDDEEMTLEKINEQLVEKNDLLKNVAGTTSELGKITEQSLKQEIANLNMAREIRELAEIEATKAKAADFFALGGEQELPGLPMFGQSQRQMRRNIQSLFDGTRKDIRDHNEQVIAAQEALEKDYPILFSFIKQHEVDNMEDLEAVIDQFYKDLERRSEENVASIVDNVGTGIQAFEEFTNAREELFFGSRANMTGDLIRQVQQQGVENLITSTEVVMTNVFNGLTIPEMVDIIVEQIERRGLDFNYNMT